MRWCRLAERDARPLVWARSPSMHAPSLLVDDGVSVAESRDLNLRSTYLDAELMLVVRVAGLEPGDSRTPPQDGGWLR